MDWGYSSVLDWDVYEHNSEIQIFIDELKQRSREMWNIYFNKAKNNLYMMRKTMWYSYNSIKWVLGMDFGNILK